MAGSRMDVVAGDHARAEKAADLLVHEVTGYRASTLDALEAQYIEEDGREACCHRSRRPGIADLFLPRLLKTWEPRRVIVETSAEAFAIADAAISHGHQVRVVPATLAKTLGIGERGVKTDKRDARKLSEVSCQIDHKKLQQVAENHPICQKLMTVLGIGPVTAIRFIAAIDDVTRFRNAHAVQSYTPGEHSSSDSQRRTGITKAGPSKLRRNLIQAAWC
jgi:transposase